MDVECITDVPSHIWERIVSKDPNSYYFHTPAWARIIERSYGYRIATCLFQVDDEEFLIPMMMKDKYGFHFLHSMPRGYSHIFSSVPHDRASPYLSIILDRIIKDHRAYLNMTMSPFFDMVLPENILKGNIVINNAHVHMMRLDDGWENRIRKDNRKAIRKAEKNLTVREGSSMEDYENYYHLYVESSKRWGYKTPPQPYELYANMQKYGSPNVKLFLAYKDDVPIAGLVSLFYGRIVFGFSSCYLREYSTLRAQNLLTYYSAKYAADNGYMYYDYGESHNNPGIERFKETFGMEKYNICRYIIMSKPFNSLASATYSISRSLISLL